MKHKEPIALLLIGAMLSGLITVGAAEAGSAVNPLISLDWLQNTFIPEEKSDVEERVNEALDEGKDEIVSLYAQGEELRVKYRDVLWLDSGSNLTVLAGNVSVSALSDGTVVDLSDGVEVPLGSAVAKNHRYLSAEESRIGFVVESDTAVVRFSGSYELAASTEIDYNAMAEALKTMGLFKGNDVPYGSGFDLESSPTRLQGLVMFLRLIGEEQYALNYPGSGIGFADVPDWGLPYVAYAYDKGYTKGQSVDEQWRVVFGSEQVIAAKDYVTFLLRALGYEEKEEFSWETAISDAQTLGFLTEGEVQLLTDKPFLRAEVVYLSYISLSAQMAGESEGILLNHLVDAGVVSRAAASSAMENFEFQKS